MRNQKEQFTPGFLNRCWPLLMMLMMLLNTSISKADIITSLVGNMTTSPISVNLDTPDGAYNVNGQLHVVGSHNGRAAREIINLSTRQSAGITYFDSLASANGGSGSNVGMIRDVRLLNSGQVMYVGQSAGSFSATQPTSWTAPGSPQGGVGPVGGQAVGSYLSLSSTGRFVGTSGEAIYGIHGNLPQLLPGGSSADIARSISMDGMSIAGDYLWVENNFGGFDTVDTSGFDFSVTGGSAPNWKGTEYDPVTGEYVYAGEFFDVNTFANTTGIWRDGDFLFGTGANTTFTDFEIYEGQLVLAVNGATNTSLYAITDGSNVTLSSLFDEDTLIYNDGLFEGSVGILGQGSSGIFVSTITAVPEPSSAMLLLMAGLGLVNRRRRCSSKS